jgi:hypothetical protein
MSDTPEELETIDPNNQPDDDTGPRPIETIDPNNQPDDDTGPRPSGSEEVPPEEI